MSEQVTRRNFLLSDTHVVRCHLPGDSATPPHHSLLLPVQSHNKGSQVRGELYGSRHVVLFFFIYFPFFSLTVFFYFFLSLFFFGTGFAWCIFQAPWQIYENCWLLWLLLLFCDGITKRKKKSIIRVLFRYIYFLSVHHRLFPISLKLLPHRSLSLILIIIIN